LGQLTEAREDIEAAKTEMSSPSTLTLAGMIEYDQGDYETARGDLDTSAAADDTDCTAKWYLGLVGIKRNPPTSAVAAFDSATRCYRSRAKLTADEIRQLATRTDLDAAYRAHQVESLEASVSADENQARAAERVVTQLTTQLGGSTPHH